MNTRTTIVNKLAANLCVEITPNPITGEGYVVSVRSHNGVTVYHEIADTEFAAAQRAAQWRLDLKRVA